MSKVTCCNADYAVWNIQVCPKLFCGIETVPPSCTVAQSTNVCPTPSFLLPFSANGVCVQGNSNSRCASKHTFNVSAHPLKDIVHTTGKFGNMNISLSAQNSRIFNRKLCLPAYIFGCFVAALKKSLSLSVVLSCQLSRKCEQGL